YPSFYGGFETLVRHLAPFLADNGWDVTVYGRRARCRAHRFDRDDRVDSIMTRGIDSRSLSTLTHGFTAAIDAARRKPDVALVLNVANGFFLPMLQARGIPTVVNVDGLEWERAKWGRGAKAAFRSGAKLTARYADSLVYDSREIASSWSVNFHRDGDFIPYGGTDPGPLDPIEELSDRPYALLVARFVPENSIDEFLTAAEELGKKWNIAIVGSASKGGGELEDRAAALSSQSSRIHWFGHLDDDRKLFALWQHAGVYFHGHSVGGTNPSLVQAMACGTPIVARDTVFNREVLADTGIFTSPEPAEIAATIDSLLNNPEQQQKLRIAAKLRHVEHYSWESVCNAYAKTLSVAINQHAQASV
ncbi:MAG: glycosyltransferase, partial [Candidatus Nanopelagicales bacterium]